MQEVRFTPENITDPRPDEVVVFGANERGQHGGGLAKIAHKKWGAVWGKGEGHYGQSYALPTKSTPWQTLDIDQIKPYVARLYAYVTEHPGLTFLITKVGCGLAKLTAEEIAPLFFRFIFLDNITMPEEFFNIIKAKCDKVIEKHIPDSSEKMTPKEVLTLFFSAGVELYDMPEEGGKRVMTTIPTHVQCVDVVNGNTDLVQLGFSPDLVENDDNPFRVSEKLIHVQSHTFWMVVYARPASIVVEVRPFSLPAAVISEGDDFIWFKTVLHDDRVVAPDGFKNMMPPGETTYPNENTKTMWAIPLGKSTPPPITYKDGFPEGPTGADRLSDHLIEQLNEDARGVSADILRRWAKDASQIWDDSHSKPKPVLGAMPQWLWREHRVEHLTEAIQRYKDASQSVPVDIEAELTEHQAWLKQYGPK